MDAQQYLSDLIKFESTSVLSNKPVSDYVEGVLKRQGFATERVEYDDPNGVRKVNVIGKKGNGHGGMGYFGHTDVVPADPWFTDEHGPFEPTVKDGRLYGRGSCDMKGSIACMLAAAEQFNDTDLKRPIYITCTSDEEIGYGGAAQVAERSNFFREMAEHDTNGIIGEPTLLEVVYAHKGTFGIQAISHGVAAHSSTNKGTNANLAMIPFLMEMKRIHDETEADPAWHHQEFDPPSLTWNIGINDHTKAVNITPPQSICTVYFRPMPGQNPEILIDRAAAVAKECGIEFKTVCRANPMYVDPKSEIVAEVMSIADRTTPQTVSYGTDGAMFGAMKNLVVFGPGSIEQAHTHDEWIDLGQLELGTARFGKLVKHWCCD